MTTMKRLRNGERYPGKAGFIYSAIFLGILIITILIIRGSLVNSIRNEFIEEKETVLIDINHRISKHYNHIRDNLQYLSNIDTIRAFLEEKNERSKTEIESLMAEMMDLHPGYGQLRIINTEGLEVIRLDQNIAGEIILCGDGDFQNKSNRDYFQLSLDIPPDRIFMSRFDLNIENEEIAVPHEPMLRFTRKIVNESGDFLGIAVINFRGEELLGEVTNSSGYEENIFYLINDNGYYLIHPDAGKTFGFMLEERKEFTFHNDFPNVWSAIRNTDSSQINTGNGIFLTSLINPVEYDDFETFIPFEDLLLVLHIAPEKISAAERRLNWGLTLGMIILTPCFILIGILLGTTREKNRWYLTELKRMAQRDPMTGLFNRNFLKERLEYCMNAAERRKEPLTLAYMDVNDLKLVNDTQGHEEGDRLINSTAAAIIDCVRVTDTVVRMGGDEFVVILPNCSIEKAETIMERISALLGTRGVYNNGKPWTISWGCTGFRHETDDQHSLISRADSRMYDKKKTFKGA